MCKTLLYCLFQRPHRQCFASSRSWHGQECKEFLLLQLTSITLFNCKWFEAFKCASYQSRLGRRHVCWVPAHVQHELRSDQVCQRCPCRLRYNHLILARASPKLLLQLRNRQHFPGTKIEGFRLKTWHQAYHLHLQFLSLNCLNHKIEGPFNRFPMGNPMPVPQIWSCGRSNSRQDQKLAMLGIDQFKMQRRCVHIQTSHGIDIGCVPWPQRDERRDNGRAVAISEYFGFKDGNMDVHTGSWSLAVHVFWLRGCLANVEFDTIVLYTPIGARWSSYRHKPSVISILPASSLIHRPWVELHWVELRGLLWVFIWSLLAANTSSLTCEQEHKCCVAYVICPCSGLALKMMASLGISVLAMPWFVLRHTQPLPCKTTARDWVPQFACRALWCNLKGHFLSSQKPFMIFMQRCKPQAFF